MIIHNDNWSVYIHLFPNNKTYVGITSDMPIIRWGKDGSGYKGQVVYSAIQKYGWNNIEHIIFASNLTRLEANNMEILLIEKLNSYIEGYNQTFGGEGKTKYTFEERKAVIQLWNQGKTISEISTILLIPPATIRRFLRLFNITNEELHKRGFDHANHEQDEQILKLWEQKIPNIEIAKILSCDTKTVTNALNRLNIPIDERVRRSGQKKIPILQYDLTGKFLNEYESSADACRVNNWPKNRSSNIRRGIHNNIAAYGYYWCNKPDHGMICQQIKIPEKIRHRS